MSPEDKKEWEEKAKEDQARYSEEMAAYKKTHATSPAPKKAKKKDPSALLPGQQKLKVKVRLGRRERGWELVLDGVRVCVIVM